jgi:Na+/phosphate symporter
MAAELAVELSAELQVAVETMCGQTAEMLRLTWDGFRRLDREALRRAEAIGQAVHRREKELTQWITERVAAALPPSGGHRGLLFAPSHLERIGDYAEDLIRCTRTMASEGTLFTERAIRELNTLFERAIELVECARDAIRTGNRVLFRHIPEEGERFQALASEFALAHQQRLIEGVCLARASSLYLAMLDALRGIERHTCEIARPPAGEGAPAR